MAWALGALIVLMMLSGVPSATAQPRGYSPLAVDEFCERCQPLARRYNQLVRRYDRAVDNYERRKYQFEEVRSATESTIRIWREYETERDQLEKKLSRYNDISWDLFWEGYRAKHGRGAVVWEEEIAKYGRGAVNRQLQAREADRQIKKIEGQLASLKKEMARWAPKYNQAMRDRYNAWKNLNSADLRVRRISGQLQSAMTSLRICTSRYCSDAFGAPSDPFSGILPPIPSRLVAIARREKGEPPLLELPSPHSLKATVSRGIPLPLELPSPHNLTATVIREEGSPPMLVELPSPHNLKATVSRDPVPIEEPEDRFCQYGVAPDGTCLDEPQLIIDEDGDIRIEIILVSGRDGNDPFDPTDPVSTGGTTTTATGGTGGTTGGTGGTTGGTGGTTGGTGGGGFDFNLIVAPPGFFESPFPNSCGAGSTYISFAAPILTSSFFPATNTTFRAAGNVATSTSNNLVILGQPGHTCTVTPVDKNTFTFACKNNNTGATCSDVWTRIPPLP